MPFPITQEGYSHLQERVKLIKEEYEKLPAVIAHARSRGDLKENAEYHAAREKQGMLKAEMDKLNADLAGSQIVDPSKLPAGVVTFGKKVTALDLDSKEEVTYVMVGPAESDMDRNRISVTSQIGKGFLGKKQGEEVTVVVPAGTKRFLLKVVALP